MRLAPAEFRKTTQLRRRLVAWAKRRHGEGTSRATTKAELEQIVRYRALPASRRGVNSSASARREWGWADRRLAGTARQPKQPPPDQTGQAWHDDRTWCPGAFGNTMHECQRLTCGS